MLLRGAIALGAIVAYEGAMALRRLGDRLMLAGARASSAPGYVHVASAWTQRERPEA
jgi:hypothetical protein